MSTLDPHAPTNTDRIALANHLYELAESFLLEATLWKDDEAKVNLARTGRKLAEVARALPSGAADYPKSNAYAEAADFILKNVIACRRFFTTVLTPRGSVTQ